MTTDREQEILRANRPYGGYRDEDLKWIESEIARLTVLRAAILKERKEQAEMPERIVRDAFAKAFGVQDAGEEGEHDD